MAKFMGLKMSDGKMSVGRMYGCTMSGGCMSENQYKHYILHHGIAGWDNRTLVDLSFRHITTKTRAYSGSYGFFKTFFGSNSVPPPAESLFENTMKNDFFSCLKCSEI